MYSQRPGSCSMPRCSSCDRPDRAGPAPLGYGLGQEDRAKAVRHPEVRIERRHQIEQRDTAGRSCIGCAVGAALAAVIDDRAHPVDVGDEVVEAERQPLRQRTRPNPHHAVRRLVRFPAAIADDLHRQRHRHQRGDRRIQPAVRRARCVRHAAHLKSRRRKMATAAVSSDADVDRRVRQRVGRRGARPPACRARLRP